MDNNEQNKTSSGLSEENMKWLEEMAQANTPAPESKPETEPESTSEKVPDSVQETTPEVTEEAPSMQAEEKSVEEKSAEEKELDDILATDWDHIDLSEETVPEEEPAPAPSEPEIDSHNDPNAGNPIDMLTIMDDEDDEPIAEEPEENSRPKKKDTYGLFGIPHILSTAIWILLILAIGISLGRVLWVCCADLMAFGKEDMKVTITITAEDDIDSISEKLGQAKLVKYPVLFKYFATLTGKDDDICVGTFTLSPRLDYNAMINAMYRDDTKREVVEIMFPEGVNCAQIFKLLEENGVCSVAALEEYAAKGDLNSYWFLEGLPRGDKYCLEGYLAPDTYAFYKSDSPRRVLEKFLAEFDERFTDKMRDNFETMKKQYASMLRKNGFSETVISENELTIHQVITLASIVQKEAANEDEGYQIAAVFYARLCDPKIMSLGADITVHYALGDYFYDIQELTVEQLDFDSPYNTRKNKGIPPGPICNMGVQSIYAVLEPSEDHYQYRFFVYDRNNKVHVFTKTEKEHDKVKKELGY